MKTAGDESSDSSNSCKETLATAWNSMPPCGRAASGKRIVVVAHSSQRHIFLDFFYINFLFNSNKNMIKKNIQKEKEINPHINT